MGEKNITQKDLQIKLQMIMESGRCEPASSGIQIRVLSRPASCYCLLNQYSASRALIRIPERSLLIRYIFNGKVLAQKSLDCANENGVVKIPELKDLTLYVEKSRQDLLNRSSYVKSYCLHQSP